MCLVLNKIDRLIVGRKMHGQQIYTCMVQIVELVNSLLSSLIKGDLMEAGLVGEAFD